LIHTTSVDNSVQGLLEIIYVDLRVFVPFLWKVFFWKNGLYWAFVYAKSTIDAGVGVNVQHLCLCKAIVVSHWMNAINWTNIHARRVFGSNTGFGNNVSHSGFVFFLLTVEWTCNRNT